MLVSLVQHHFIDFTDLSYLIQHGMGMPSASILLHEVFKLLHYAGAKDIALFRMGTSGGLGNAALHLYISCSFVICHIGPLMPTIHDVRLNLCNFRQNSDIICVNLIFGNNEKSYKDRKVLERNRQIMP